MNHFTLLNLSTDFMAVQFLKLAITGSLVVSLAALLNRFGRFSAVARHLIWTLAFCLTLTMTIGILLPSAATLPLLPSWMNVTSFVEQGEVAEGPAITGKALNTSVAGEITSNADKTSSTNNNRTWTEWLLLFWGIGILCMFAKIFFDLLVVFMVNCRAKHARNPWLRQRLVANKTLVAIRRPVRLKFSEIATTPFTTGIVFPLIILPDYLQSASSTEQNLVLRHELAHVARYDFLTTVVARFCLALFWFNPLFHFAFRGLRHEQEKACDDWVLLSGVTATDYADCLLRTIRDFRSWRLASLRQVPGMATNVTNRIQTILDESQYRKSFSLLNFFGTILGISLLGLLMGMVRPAETTLQQTQIPAYAESGIDSTGSIQKPLSLSDALAQSDYAVRITSVKEAGRRKDPANIPLLKKLLQDANNDVQLAAVEALGAYRSRALFYHLLPKIDNPSPLMRVAVLKALAGIGCEPAFLTVSCYLRDPDAGVRRAAAQYLQHFDVDLIDKPLPRILQAQGRTNHGYLQKYVPELPQRSAMELLEELALNDFDKVAVQAFDTLSHFGK